LPIRSVTHDGSRKTITFEFAAVNIGYRIDPHAIEHRGRLLGSLGSRPATHLVRPPNPFAIFSAWLMSG
jgi:hypothetical protein